MGRELTGGGQVWFLERELSIGELPAASLAMH